MIIPQQKNKFLLTTILTSSAGAKCFVAATPEPLQENDILNVKCRLCGNKKIPIYAVAVKSSITQIN
jgi:hypothetical protein